MRGGFRNRQGEDEEESAFVSMTDMTVGFLFIVILLLAYFAQSYSEKDFVPRPLYEEVKEQRDRQEQEIAQLKAIIEELRKSDPLEAYLTTAAIERHRMLTRLRDQLKIDFPDLDVVISEETDALRFQGDGLFSTGSAILRSDRRHVVETLATRLQDILPCYTIGEHSKWEQSCNTGYAIIEALQIEGHTDSTGDFIANLGLSTARANSTFSTMLGISPLLVDFLNFRSQPVLSVAGYGQMRPVKDNRLKEGRDTNRRVDLRIIMYTPSQSSEIDNIRQALQQNGMERQER